MKQRKSTRKMKQTFDGSFDLEKIMRFSALLKQTRLSDYEMFGLLVPGYEYVKQFQLQAQRPLIVAKCHHVSLAYIQPAYIPEQQPFLSWFLIITRDKFHKGTDL